MKQLFIRIVSIIMLITALFCTASAAEGISNPKTECGYELSIEGATGYGLIDLTVRSADNSSASKIMTAAAGQPFTILQGGNAYFKVRFEDGTIGWVYKNYTLVNLPDVIPSIVYNDTNATGSLFRSEGLELEGVTGQSLYSGKTYNARLGYVQFNMPVLYPMTKKIAAAQSAALANSETLVLYEGYRPMSAQTAVCNSLRNLMSVNSTIRNDISKWGVAWFISTGVSNHQRGYAIDVALASVDSTKQLTVDDVVISIPVSYTTLNMPTQMHELSPRAATFTRGVKSNSKTAWKSAARAKTMTDDALKLQTYCTNAGLTPLASEWWHFNDWDAQAASNGNGLGNFMIDGNLSVKPSEIFTF